jgi:hypothetical protein
MRAPLQRRQRGAVLVIAMVILMVIAALSLSSLRAGDSSQQINANLQSRQEGLDAAQVAIERVLSTREFFTNPIAITGPPYSPVSIDLQGDTKADFSVAMQRPECLRARPVTPNELDPASARDRACLSSASLQESGLVGTPGQSGSICSDTEWQLSAQAASAATGTNVTVRQGVAVRVRTTDADSFCNP